MSDKKTVFVIALACIGYFVFGITCPNIVLKVIFFCACAFLGWALWLLLAPAKNKGDKEAAPSAEKQPADSGKKYPKNFGFDDEYAFTSEVPLFEYNYFRSSKEKQEQAWQIFRSFQTGQARKLDTAFGYGSAHLFTGGTYKKVLRLYSSVPTFDESDRDFDAYRVTVIFCDSDDKYYLAKYSGGLALANLEIYGELIRFPKEYEALLK